MLQQLTVENYALIDSLHLELGEGLNIITGETGAGKSILLGALGLLLGSRADLSAVKNQAKNCVVEGVFNIEGYKLEDFFENYDLDYEPTCIVRRVITTSGKSRAFINELPVQISTLKEFGLSMIDIHSQHQTLLLADGSFQLKVLDTTAENTELLAKYSSEYQALKLLEHQLIELIDNAQKAQDDKDYIEHQYQELNGANLKIGEQQSLELELARMTNSEQITEALSMCTTAMENEVGGILVDLKNIATSFAKTSQVYDKGEEFSSRLRACLEELKDIYAEAEGQFERIDSDPELMQKTSDRLDFIFSLQQKHRLQSVEELIELRDSYSQRLNTILSFDENIASLEAQIAQTKEKAQALAQKITVSRGKAAKTVSAHLNKSLKHLGMPTSNFEVAFELSDKLTATGVDMISFMFSSASGLRAERIEKVASGGELSRVMLSIKSLVAQRMKLPTIIFDEIDTGVSGRIADAMGEIITVLGQTMQVINITHLPQVACKGDNHYVVSKQTVNGMTTTSISKLDKEQRVEEIAKMLSGATITQSAKEQAKFLLGEQ